MSVLPPDTSPETLEQAFAAQMMAILPSPDLTVGVAVSGGSDSMALVLLAHNCRISIRAVIVDHGLRPESRAEAEQARQWLQARGIAADGVQACIPQGTGNRQARYRAGRYQALTTWANTHAIRQVMLGHQLEDQAETILAHLIRGSGIPGLAGMAAVRQRGGITFVRPLLGFHKQTLRAYLTHHQQAWIEDPGNQNPAYHRTHIRALWPGLYAAGLTPGRLHTAIDHLQDMHQVLTTATSLLMQQVLRRFASGWCRIYLPDFAKAAPTVRSAMLRQVLRQVGRQDTLPDVSSLPAEYTPTTTLAGCLLSRHRDHLHIIREDAALPPATPVPAPGLYTWDGWTCTAPAPGRLRGLRRDGLFQLSPAQKKALSALPHPVTLALPALFDGDTLIAVHGLSGKYALKCRPPSFFIDESCLHS